jgi:BirA family biotin operon repressor/biotin-[acetyl-CoA-carboxylase] ligase
LSPFKHIKLDQVESTNSFLKNLCKELTVDDFTVVIAEHQTAGRGQQNAVWQAEKGKNLTFSFYLSNQNINDLFLINIAVALAIRQTVFSLTQQPTFVKWSNDVVVNHKKIAGILIENIFSSDKIHSIIGIGLNVNQLIFNDLDRATSLQQQTMEVYDLENVLELLETNIYYFINQKNEELWLAYHQYLYKINEKITWQLPNGTTFFATLKGVTTQGKIILEKDNLSTHNFANKEVLMVW